MKKKPSVFLKNQTKRKRKTNLGEPSRRIKGQSICLKESVHVILVVLFR